MNFCVCCARKSTGIPARSSRTATTPPDAPIPGIDGGGKANAIPYGTFARASSALTLICLKCSCKEVRFSQGLRVIKKNPLYVVLTPLNRLKPAIEVTDRTPGMLWRMSETVLQAAVVRCSDAASGNCRLAYM